MIGTLTILIVAAGMFVEPGFSISPAEPVQGGTLQISFDARAGGVSFQNLEELSLMYVIESEDTVLVNAESMSEEAGVWTHSVEIPADAYFIKFKLEDSLGRAIDNGQRWYNLQVYTKEKGVAPNAHLSTGLSLLFSERPDHNGAKSELTRELQVHPWNWKAYKGLWDVKISSVEWNEAAKSETMREIDELLKSARDSIPLLYETAIMTYAELGEFGYAQELMIRLLKHSPEEERLGRAANALFLALTSTPDDLKEIAEHLLSLASADESETIMYHYYVALNLSFQPDQALEVLTRFLEDHPHSDKMPLVAYRYIQATTEFHTMDHAKALEEYLRKYRESPLRSMAYLSLADFYSSTDWKMARSYYKKAIEADSSQPRVYNHFAYSCAEKSVDLGEAEQAVLKAIDLADHNYYRRRFLQLSFAEREEARARDLAAFYDTHGWIEFGQEEYGDAIYHLERAVAILGEENADSEVLRHLGEAYLISKRFDEAIETYLKILRTEPEDEELKERALSVWEQTGRSEQEFYAALSAASRTPGEHRPVAPEFTAKNLEDVELTLAHLRGKVVVLNFWATWCAPCRKEIPLLNDLVHSFQDGPKVIFLAISSEKEKVLETFTKSYEFGYDVCHDEGGISRSYGVVYIPTHVVIDREGRIYSRHIGFKPRIDRLLESEIRDALDEPSR